LSARNATANAAGFLCAILHKYNATAVISQVSHVPTVPSSPTNPTTPAPKNQPRSDRREIWRRSSQHRVSAVSWRGRAARFPAVRGESRCPAARRGRETGPGGSTDASTAQKRWRTGFAREELPLRRTICHSYVPYVRHPHGQSND